MLPVVLSVAGSDPSGGAGIQADLAAIAANRGYGATAITAITVQNTRGVTRVDPLAAHILRDQLDAVLDDLDVGAVKSGMLATVGNVEVLATTLAERKGLPYVCDPVLVSTSGHPLLEAAGIELLKQRLLPRATVVTPNLHEASLLSGRPVEDLDGAERAARCLLDDGVAAVLVTGGHFEEERGTDVLVTAAGAERIAAPTVDTPHTHGGGCVYSAAIATWLARGAGLVDAVQRAKAFVTQALQHAGTPGGGRGPVEPLFELRGAATAVRRDGGSG
jgi:hydroxymethylpyrimidine/phosphomethylpyrimidine kinase